jgi:hypothetical protein
MAVSFFKVLYNFIGLDFSSLANSAEFSTKLEIEPLNNANCKKPPKL